MKNVASLLKQIYRLCILALIFIGVYLIFSQLRKCNRNSDQDFSLEQTPLVIENIESIAQIATLTYREEFVADTIEYYDNANDRIAGELDKVFRQGDIKNILTSGNIDRRLTLITTVDAQLGFDLKNIQQKKLSADTLLIKIPNPTILYIGIDYRASEIFIEIGQWTDKERQQLEKKSITKALHKFKQSKNYTSSKLKFESLIRSSVPNKTCIFEYYESY